MSIELVTGLTPTEFPLPVGVLNAPTNFARTATGAGSTTLEYDFDAPAQGTAIGFRIIDDATKLQSGEDIDWATGKVVGTATGLDPETPYSHYVVTFDADDESVPSNTAGDTTAAAAAWNLPAANYISTDITKMLPNIISPRSAAVTTSDCYSRNCHTGIAWEHPIIVQGGSYPFKFELTDALGDPGVEGTDYPVGMTIGETLTKVGDVFLDPNNDYGVLSWPNPVGTSETAYVTVTDQDGNQDIVDLSLAIGTANWVVVNAATGSDSNPGTLASPKLTFFEGVYEAGQNGKIAMFMDGDYLIHNNTFDAAQGRYGEAIIQAVTSPRSYVPHPDATLVRFQTIDGRFQVNACNDFFVGEISIEGYKDTAQNWKCVFLNDDGLGYTFHKTTWDEQGIGGHEWTSGRQYYVNDWFYVGGINGDSYNVRVEHVAGTFQTDFESGNFIIAGTTGEVWAATVVHVLTDLVRSPDQNDDYQCVVAHTAGAIDGTFNSDLLAGYWAIAERGHIGNDNPGCVVAWGLGGSTFRHFIGMSRCTLGANTEMQMFSSFNSEDMVHEHNVCLQTHPEANNGWYFIHYKDQPSNVSLRHNTAISYVLFDSRTVFSMSTQTEVGSPMENMECCYNTVYVADSVQIPDACEYSMGGNNNDTVTNIHSYRNTYIQIDGIAISTLTAGSNAEPYDIRNNVLFGGNEYITGPAAVPVDNFLVTDVVTQVDTGGKLIGQARIDYLGTHGSEISD